MNSSMNATPANDSWVSEMQKKSNVPRSTSVEYEKETQSTNIRNRLPPPPSRTTKPSRPPPSASRHVYDVDIENNTSQRPQRGKSPFEQVIESTKNITATFLMRRQPDDSGSRSAPANGTQDKSSSYEYSAEEREFQESLQQDQAAQRKANNAAHRRGRMSTDNKAYKPTQSDLEDSDDDDGDDRKRKKKSKRYGAAGGPLTTLPTTTYDKRKKKRRGARGDGQEEDGEEGSDEEEQPIEQVAQEVSNVCIYSRTSNPSTYP